LHPPWAVGRRAAFALAAAGLSLSCLGGNLVGYVQDLNWYARRPSGSSYGVGYYEFAVNANSDAPAMTAGTAATDVLGRFQISGLSAGRYTVVSWDVWWRSAIAFGVNVPPSGNSPTVNLRLGAAMWGYPAFWDDAGYHEFGQTFVPTGPISMVYLRCPAFTGAPVYTLTVHEKDPTGPQVGVARSFGAGDQRPVYGFGEMPTLAGRTYYLRVRAPTAGKAGVIMQMDPRPDGSDPMPGGCLWLGSPGNVTPHPDRDLGVVLMCDDDGLVTDLFTRPNGAAISEATSVGQTFIARGVHLISAAFWLADPAGPTYEVRIRAGGPGGALIGTPKRGKPARLFADPEMLVAWAPGECPLTPGSSCYVEITRAGGGVFRQAMVNRSNPFPHGTAWLNGNPVAGVDLAGTLLEEESPGAAAKPTVQFRVEPAMVESTRQARSFEVRWTTDQPTDSVVEFAAFYPPYTDTVSDTNLLTDHAVTLTNLLPHTPYHWRVRSGAPDRRAAVSRDLAVCTLPETPNLLANPGFEEGTGASPRKVIPGWSKSGGLDMQASDGSWFWGIPPRTGTWLFEGAANASSSEGLLYQRVKVTRGRDYVFSAWVTTWMRENDTWKYDVWNDRGRLIHMRLGIDPAGGVNSNAASVRWTPRSYSHLHYRSLALAATATADYLTVFVAMQGQGGQWHLYGMDDCVLTEAAEFAPRLLSPGFGQNGRFEFTVVSAPGKTNEIQAGSSFDDWSPIGTIVNVCGQTRFQDDILATPGSRYYRAVLR